MSGSTLDFSGFAPAYSPGQSGIGGFVAPTVDDPLTAVGQTGNVGPVGGLFGGGGVLGTGVSDQDLSKALKALGGGGGATGAGTKTPTGAPGSQSMNMAQSSATRGGGAAGLDALVRMLNARRDALLPQPVGISAAAQQRPTAGLLGF